MRKIFNLKIMCRRLTAPAKALGLIAVVLIMTSCAESISHKFLKQVDNKNLTFSQLIKNPDQYIGNTIFLGGVIVSVDNKNDGTLLEIYQTELDSTGEPKNIDVSMGRFLAWHKGFLDGQIYRSGRKITIVGEIRGIEVRKLGEIDYRYPYLIIKDIYLWSAAQKRYSPYYHQRYYGPWWRDPWYRGYYPYWGFNYYQYPNLRRHNRVK